MTSGSSPRRPRVFDADDPALSVSDPTSTSPLDESTDKVTQEAVGNDMPATGQPPPAPVGLGNSLNRGLRWGALLFSAMLALLVLTTSVWLARFTSVALGRDDWVGWLAQGLLFIALFAAAVLILKEVLGILRMKRLTRIRKDAEAALATGDRKLEKRAIKALKALARGRKAVKWSLAAFREDERHMKEAGKLIGLADRVLLAEADKHARRIVFESARRVGVITAVVPVALLVTVFVLAENVRMVRRLADAYGGQPGLLGGIRLLWRIIMHVAATGAIALTDDLFGQFLGQDIARRVSRRLGEGAFVGALTARLGVAAIDMCRPLPFVEAKPVRSRHIIRELFPEIRSMKIMKGTTARSDKMKDEEKP